MAVLPLQCSFIDAASRTLSTTKRAANATTFPQLILTCTSYSLALRNTAAFPNYLRVETNCIDYKRSLFISKHGAEVIVRASPIAVSEGQKDEALKEVSEEIKSGAKLDSNGGGGEGGGGYKFGGGGGGGGEEEEEEEAEGGGGGGGGEKKEDRQMALSMSQKFTLCYAALVGVGGLMGYVKSGSSKSLISGGLSALVLYYVHTQLPTNTVFASSVGLGISAVLLTVMGARFRKSGKIFLQVSYLWSL